MIAHNARWAVQGDRVLTYMSEKPETAKIIAGSWWSKDYRGPPAISLDAGLARGFEFRSETHSRLISWDARSPRLSIAFVKSIGVAYGSISQ